MILLAELLVDFVVGLSSDCHGAEEPDDDDPLRRRRQSNRSADNRRELTSPILFLDASMPSLAFTKTSPAETAY